MGVFRWTNPNGGQNGGQTHSQTKESDLVRARLCIAIVRHTICRLDADWTRAGEKRPAPGDRPQVSGDILPTAPYRVRIHVH